MMMVSYFPLVGFFVSCNVELRLVGVKGGKRGGGGVYWIEGTVLHFVVSMPFDSAFILVACWKLTIAVVTLQIWGKKEFCSVLSSLWFNHFFLVGIFVAEEWLVMLFLNIYFFFFQFSFLFWRFFFSPENINVNIYCMRNISVSFFGHKLGMEFKS